LPEELDETTNAWVDGFRQIRKKLEGMLSDQGVTTIPLDGEFDPNRHEAISSEPSESVESGHIIETLRVGYEYKGRVLRPALVRVAM
ncbi:MAG: nucleotide exchange factor GrpE, partial [Caldilineaceae bacterium]|nr:nucleotide exchange factor GrpE [Caldilineaceae bacterium]